MSIKNDPGVSQALAAAIRAAEASPDSNASWDHLESLAETAQRPDDVARAYRELLRTSLTPALRTHLAERAVRFHDEWYGDQPQVISDLLLQIIERDPQARWALDRLTVALTNREDWSALLAVYDRVLVHVTGEAERREILSEAARVAKEFADKPELAADYMLKQLAVDRDNQKLQSSVERLLERLERWRDLVGLWEGQATELPPVESRELRLKIAAAYVERLDDPQRALAELRALLDESPGNPAACAALERLLSLETASVDLRKGALALLRKSYDAAGRTGEVVRLLGLALRFASVDDRPALHRELANRRALAGDDVGAMESYGEVLRLTPSDGDARKQLRQIAARIGRSDLHAAALIAAAGATEGAQRLTLLVDAAQIRQGALGDLAGAAALYRQILDAPESEPQTASIAAHSLSSLLTAEDQREERLAVLERLADLEPTPAIRLAILGEAADLAESLGKRQRALGIWMHRLDQSPADVAAMSAVIRLLEALERWEDLVKALLRRADAPVIRLQRRADLLKAAEIVAFRLGNIDAAIDLLLGVRESFGEDPEVLAALDRQLTACARFSELAGLLERSARTSASHTGWLYVRAAEIQLRDLEDNLAAARLYAEALSLDPGRREAIDGLREVIGDERCAEIATMSLIGAHKRTDDWEGMLGLVEHRLRLADNDHERARILGEAAYIQEKRALDPVGARATLGRSLIAEPADVSREHELLRLAQVTGAFRECADTLGAAAERAADTPARAAQLWYSRGIILARELHDIHEATLAYARAAELEPQRRIYQEAAAQSGAQAGLWEIAARAAVQALNGHAVHDQGVLGDLDRVTREKSAEATVAAAASRASVEFAGSLAPAAARRLERTIAGWYDVTGDADKAIAATRRALERDPGDLETLRELAGRLAGRPAIERIDVLLKIDAVAELDLDALREAAALAVAHEGEVGGAEAVELAKNTVYRLYRKAARMWSRGETATGSRTPADAVEWALEDLTRRASPEVAARLLLDCATLPVSAERSRQLRRAAAELLAGQGQRARAIDLYFGILSEGDETLADILRVAGLCEEEGRTAELLELRTRELTHERDPARRLQLRLNIAGLAGELETRDSRISALRANLAEKPGHAETLEILQTVLAERGRFAELAEMLEDQARQVAAAGDEAAAAGLWSRTAQIAEEALSDPERAIAAFTRVVEIQSDHHAIDALARLHLQREEPAQAALWLKRRIEGAGAGERVPILLKLARAQIKAGDPDAAIEALQAAFNEAPRSGEVRRLLLGLLREKGDPVPLAHALATSAQNVSDSAMVLAFAREAAELFQDKIGAPELAVPVLEKAIALAGDDRTLKIMLARGLLSSGRLPEAKELLAQIIDGFGRRRSPERAQIHLLLAQVLHAEGEVALAIDQLEAASSMDPGNIAILTNLAELAQQSGQLARAERAYRTLLVNIRRTDLTVEVEIGPAEVLLKLSRIAQARGQDDKATELVESVIDAIGESDDEAARIQDDLRARGDLALLRRVLEARLGHAQGRLRADVLGELAGLLDGDLGLPEQALDARLRALDADPGAPERHDAARALAERLGRPERYSDHVAGLLETTRRPSDAHARCELLRLAEALEASGDLVRAADLLTQAEGTGVRQIDVWRAGARVAAGRGDTETQVRLLGLLARLGASEDESRVDALYRVAEIQLADPNTEEAGLDALTEALAEEPRPTRAALVLQQASARGEPTPRLLALYEEVARKAGDDNLLHALERRAARADASAAIVREGVDLAIRTGQGERADALLARALELGHGVPWALLALARRKIDQGDLAAAVRYLGEAIEPADLGDVLPLAGEICDLSLREGGDPTLPAPLYQRLLEREGAKRAIWEPLCGIYRALGDIARLEQLVADILDGLEDPRDRIILRLALVDALAGREGREADVSALLRATVADDPSDGANRARLTDHLRAIGDQDGLLGLLRDQLAAAEAAGDGDAVRGLTVQLAAGLRESRPDEALALAHAALAAAPEDRELLRLVLDLGQGDDEAQGVSERGALMERLLVASEGDEAAAIARELHGLRKGAGDDAGARRALEIGVARAPGDQGLFDLLEGHLRDGGDARALAHLLAESAKAREDSAERANLLREAALILRDREGDPAGAAVLLMDAAEADPSDPAVKLELAATLSMAGDLEAALETIEAGLQSSPDLAQHVAFLRSRAAIQIKVGRLDAAIADLDEAYSIDPDVTVDDMIAALAAAIAQAEQGDDYEAERGLIFRLADLHLAHGQDLEARERLSGWVVRAPGDIEGMTRLWRLDAQTEDWESVINIGSKLIIMATGKLQVEAALALADASIQLGRSQAARFGLEYVRSKQPESREIREKLVQLYEHLGAVRELAGLLLEDASQQQNPAMRLATLRRAADMLLDHGDRLTLIPVLAEIVALDPADRESALTLAGVHLQAGNLEDADVIVSQIIASMGTRRSPELGAMHYRKALIARARADRDAELHHLQEALANDKDNGLLAAELAELAEVLENWDVAMRVLRTITMMESGECPITKAQAYARQARIAHRTGDPKRAIFWARRATQEDPELEEAHALLRHLEQE